MATEPKTYRVSEEVDTELSRLAKIHGGVDKALRVVLGIGEPLTTGKLMKRIAAQVTPRPFKGTLPKPSEQKK